jgi:hypothetical protein
LVFFHFPFAENFVYKIVDKNVNPSLAGANRSMRSAPPIDARVEAPTPSVFFLGDYDAQPSAPGEGFFGGDDSF